MTERRSHAVLDPSLRIAKAQKIKALLENELGRRTGLRLLEFGTGSGAIASYFAMSDVGMDVVCSIDVRDERAIRTGYSFRVYDGTRAPFADAQFDVILSNHVVEHVGDRVAQLGHFREIARLLAPDGVAYIATPSRWQFVEAHFRLPGLSWLPRRLRSAYVRLAGRGDNYDCDPLGPLECERLMGEAGLEFSNRNAEALVVLARLDSRVDRLARLLARFPRSLLDRFRHWSPTMIYVAKPHGRIDHAFT